MKRRKTPLSPIFSVDSIITVYRIDFGKSKRSYSGEWHDFPELFYVEKGEHHVLVDGEYYVLSEGQAIIYAPNAYHVGTGIPSLATVDILTFDTDFEKLSSICNRVIDLGERRRRQFSEIMTQALETITPLPDGDDEMGMGVVEGVDEYDLMKLKNRMELFLLELYADKNEKKGNSAASNRSNFRSDELNSMSKYFRDNMDRMLTQDEIAAHLSISVSKLKRLCSDQLGCGPITYFMALKLGEAKNMIRASSRNFSEISEALGFGSIHHFSKFFKEKTGLSPSEYAKSIYKS